LDNHNPWISSVAIFQDYLLNNKITFLYIEFVMKKILLVLTSTLFLPNISYAVDCENGENASGCDIGTTGIDYILTGDITPASGVPGIQFTSGAENNTTTLTGNISTTGEFGDGVFFDEGLSNITNLIGNIITAGTESYGIYLSSSHSNNTNLTGDITTMGVGSFGLGLADSDSNITNLIGNISLMGDDAYGVGLTRSDSNTTTLTGSINTVGSNSYGLYLSESDLNTTTLIGSINTSGLASYALQMTEGENNTITLAGDITTTGDDARGLNLFRSNNNTITLAGDITTTGDNAYGVGLTRSDSNTTTLTGDITTTGDDAHGLYFNDSDSNIINLTGSLSATGTGADAIHMNSTSRNNTITFNKGSQIIGALYNDGTNNTLKLNLGAGRSYALETSGSSSWTIEDLNNRPMVTGSAYGIGVGNMETQGHEMYQRTYQVNQTLQQRQLANYKGNASPYWINSYYNKSSRSGSSNLSSNNLQFSNHRSGINLGYRVTQYEQPIELLFNYENSSMNHDDFNHQISSDSIMAGVFIPNIKQIAGGELSVNAMLGISDFRGSRKVMTNSAGYSGMRTISSDYQAKHYVIGASWLKELYQGEMLQTFLNIGANINHQQMESYREEAYYKFNSRDISQLQSRITLSADAQPFKNKLNINVNLGIENRNMIAGTQQGLYLNNTKTGYSHVNQTNTYLTSSLNISYPFTNTILAYAGYQYFDSGDDIKMSSGQIGVSGSF
jgi:hypothetical protein